MPWTRNNVAILAAIVPFLASCGYLPTRVERVLPPEELLMDCPAPNGLLKTNRDLAQRALDLKQSLALCNADKAALRAWSK